MTPIHVSNQPAAPVIVAAEHESDEIATGLVFGSSATIRAKVFELSLGGRGDASAPGRRP